MDQNRYGCSAWQDGALVLADLVAEKQHTSSACNEQGDTKRPQHAAAQAAEHKSVYFQESTVNVPRCGGGAEAKVGVEGIKVFRRSIGVSRARYHCTVQYHQCCENISGTSGTVCKPFCREPSAGTHPFFFILRKRSYHARPPHLFRTRF